MNKENISSHSETWALLPIIFANKKEGSLTIYSHEKSFLASEDFIDSFPNKKKDYNDLVRKYFFGIAELLSSSDAEYFVEKTPRNYLIIDEIAEIFPNAKFIFLFRNPLGIVSSLLKTKRNNRFRTFYNAKIDLFDAPRLLSKGFEKHQNRSLKLVYDELVNNPEKAYRELAAYLDLKDGNIADVELGSLSGRLGDPNIKDRKKIDNKSTNLWKLILNNPVRKYLLKEYLKSLNNKYLQYSGLSKGALINDLKNAKNGFNFFEQIINSMRDLMDLAYAYLVYKFKLEVFFKKGNKWLRKSSIE